MYNIEGKNINNNKKIFENNPDQWTEWPKDSRDGLQFIGPTLT